MSAAEENVALIRRMIEGLNQGRFAEVVAGCLAPDYVRHDLAGAFARVEGREGASDFVRLVYAALPDLRVEVREVFATEERVAAHLVYVGTHRGVLFGAAPTGRRVELHGLAQYRVAGGKVAESWQLLDLWGFMTQVGVVEPPSLT